MHMISTIFAFSKQPYELYCIAIFPILQIGEKELFSFPKDAQMVHGQGLKQRCARIASRIQPLFLKMNGTLHQLSHKE